MYNIMKQCIKENTSFRRKPSRLDLISKKKLENVESKGQIRKSDKMVIEFETGRITKKTYVIDKCKDQPKLFYRNVNNRWKQPDGISKLKSKWQTVLGYDRYDRGGE